MKPTKYNFHKVVIVGRPNVGKSTLFNRVLQKRKAIVEEFGPTTRDRIGAIVKWSGKTFELIDTPGLDFEKKEDLSKLIEKQIVSGIKEADQLIFMCDAISGILQMDYKICDMLRKADKSIILAVNKVDSRNLMRDMADFYKLGFGEPMSISSLHGLGIGDLLDKVTDNMDPGAGEGSGNREHAEKHAVKLAVIGKPNAGKSSFVNGILEEDRITVSDIPGTTRDSIDTYFEKDRKSFIIIDTAGIRSKGKIKDAVTYFSILRTEETIKKSDVTVILIDAPLGITKEDHRIIDIVQKNFRPFILAINKWDLAEKEGVNKIGYEKVIRENVRFMYNASIVFMSALKKTNLMEVLDLAYKLAEKTSQNFSTSDLNDILKSVEFNPTRLYSVRQTKNSPPELEIIAKNPGDIKTTEKSYLVNIFRKKLHLEGIPVIIKFRKKEFRGG
ncbi:MAG: ribosome biogenesis GTPase Der [Candidatus Omnitrophica bacterium CG22_combo_CG10-13_8_21_14_all_43_16]|nr:MAG: ribosome biogenesis GTPase Der [Candidatus Omnitrophica bacterium CG22_combo_CG10-13_8_21_14_all_43_16]